MVMTEWWPAHARSRESGENASPRTPYLNIFDEYDVCFTVSTNVMQSGSALTARRLPSGESASAFDVALRKLILFCTTSSPSRSLQ